MKKIKKSSISPTTWSGGKTWTYYISPIGATLENRDFNIRISSASVEVDQSIFTDYTGYIRYFSVLTNPIELMINGAKKTVSPGDLVEFSGSDQVVSYGKTIDINVFVKNSINVDVSYTSGYIKGPVFVFKDDILYQLELSETIELDLALCLRF